MSREVTIELLEGKARFQNIIFINNYCGRKPICTCGQVHESYTYSCPKCGTSHREYFSNGTRKPLDIIGVIYYTFDLLSEKSFEVKRYDLIYRIDDENRKIDKILKEHSSFIYDHDKEKTILNIGDKTSSAIVQMGRYRNRNLTKVCDDEVKKGAETCRDFYLKTGFKEFAEMYTGWGIDKFLRYIQFYKNNGYKEIELLLKAGHSKLAKEIFEKPESLLELKRGNSIKEIIKLPSNILKRIRETQSYSVKEIAVLEYIHEYGGQLTEDLYNYFTRLHEVHYGKLLDPIKELIENKYTLKEIVDYVERADLYQAIPEDDSITLLADYVRMAVDGKFPYDKFPNNLKKEHDLMAREYEFTLNELKSKEFAKVIEAHRDLEYRNSQYQIVLPKDTNDVVREGKMMRHCVASYIKKIADNKTLVLFLRRVKKVDDPFYTIEVRDGKVVQIKGFANKSVVEADVKAFIQEWINRKKLLYAA